MVEIASFGSNPVTRLHNILAELKRVVQAGVQGGNGLVIWARVFEVGVEPKDLSSIGSVVTVIERLVQLRALVEDAENALRNMDRPSDKYLRPFPRIRDLVKHSVSALAIDLSPYINQITESDMTVLELAGDHLGSTTISEPDIDEDELNEIFVVIQMLTSDIEISETMDRYLSKFLLLQLEAMRRAIFEYRLRGPERLKEGLAEVVGSIIVEQYVGQDILRANQDSDAVTKFAGIYRRFASAVTFASSSASLVESIMKLLPGG